jgi:acylphosphatase
LILQAEIASQKGNMGVFFFRIKIFLLIAAVFLTPFTVFAEGEAQKLAAVEGWVHGNVQQVGFRAFIFKQAIRYNLGGFIENQAAGSVHFILQGQAARLDEALTLIKQGPEKAVVADVKAAPCPVREDITSVTVKGWTSASRAFDHPVDLVYPLRQEDQVLSDVESRQIFKKIIRAAMLSADKAPL